MNETEFRPLNHEELELLDRLLSPEFPGRDQLLVQIRHSLVRKIDDNGSLVFSVPLELKGNGVKHAVPTEAEYVDSDGIIVHILLHVSGDKVAELQIYKEDNSSVRVRPDISRLNVFAPD
jgi:hypothetical protein